LLCKPGGVHADRTFSWQADDAAVSDDPVWLSRAGLLRRPGMIRAVARVAHTIPERAPLRLAVGDEVELGERDAEWPAFVFVVAPGGSGWVPARHLSRSSGRARVLAPYDTTELPTARGQVLDVLAEDRESGWVWCRDFDGREGWVPAKTLAFD